MSVDLSETQRQADKLAKEENPKPDFTIPSDCDVTGDNLLEIVDTESKGKGFYAKDTIKAGTTLLAAKPISMVMAWEEDEDDSLEDEEMDMDDDDDGMVMKGSKRNGMLILRTLEQIKRDPDIWESKLTNLFPRDFSDKIWICECAQTGMEIEESFNSLSSICKIDESLVDEIRHRLPLIIRYNCLSCETGAELFVHPNRAAGGHCSLSGTGLFYYPSYFNHSHKPNVVRYSIGDVMFFVTNQDIQKGQELYISYIESEHLCEDAKTRTRLLDMDFEENCEGSSKEESNKTFPVVDVDMQDDLMSIHPLERLHEIKELLKEACSDETTLDEEGEAISFFRADEHQLRILLALTYESLGQHSYASEEWEKCIYFATKHLPPNDENCISLLVQGALSAQATSNWKAVKEYSKKATDIHDLLFGGGVTFFRQRYENEIKLQLRPTSKKVLSGEAAFDLIWKE